MRRLVVILITLFILGIITIAGLEFLARIEVKDRGAIKYSSSIEASKKNNFFIGKYRPLSDTLKLSQYPGIIHFDSAFAEKGWRIDTSTLYLLNKKTPANVYNLIIYYSQVPRTNDINFDLTPVDDSSGVSHYGNKKLLYQTPQLQDTIWFSVMEKNNDSTHSWMQSEEMVGFIMNQ